MVYIFYLFVISSLYYTYRKYNGIYFYPFVISSMCYQG